MGGYYSALGSRRIQSRGRGGRMLDGVPLHHDDPTSSIIRVIRVIRGAFLLGRRGTTNDANHTNDTPLDICVSSCDTRL